MVDTIIFIVNMVIEDEFSNYNVNNLYFNCYFFELI